MLEKLKAKLGMTEAVASVTDETLKTSFEASEAKVLELSTQLAEYSSVLATMETKLDEAQASLEKYAAIATQAQAAEEALKAQMKAEQATARMSSLVDAAGTLKAEALMSQFGEADEASFQGLVSALSMNIAKEADSAEFKELGVDGSQASAEPPTTGDSFLAKIKSSKTKGTK